MQCTNIIDTLAPCLIANGTDPGFANFLSILLGVIIVTLTPLIVVILLIWVERKYAARIQDRLGPNRVGPFGLFQTFADAIKLIIKEDITPAGADRVIFNLAPIISVVSVILIWAVVPITPLHIGVDLSIGALYFVAVGSIGTIAIMMAGWSSNNKYALLGAFRVVAQLVSYEVPMVMALLVPVMLAGTMSMQEIVRDQLGMWFVVYSPIAMAIFFVSTQAETGRAPFDLIEAESELVAGYNIEYSGMKFGLFFAGEFVHVFTNALLMATLFFGGWIGPFVFQVPILGVVWLVLKAMFFYLFSLHMRNTVPRIRIDQMMSFNWKFLVPLSIINLVVVAALLKLCQIAGITPPPERASDFIANLPTAAVLLLGNLAIIGVMVQYLRDQGRRSRMTERVPGLPVLEAPEAVEVESLPVAH
jgi:NADH-quinone oxidoreductase subunit H